MSNFDREPFDAAINELGAELEKHTGFVVLVTGKVSKQDYWAYALISPVNWPAFQYAQSQGGFDLGDYASDILAQGKGKTPPKNTLGKIKIARPYLDFDFERKFKEVLEAA